MNERNFFDAPPTTPPVIGICPKCQTRIFASHPYSWCVKCNEALPYEINMARRPIIYESTSVWPFDLEKSGVGKSREH
ncbi:MAG TPA: hypothetical protein VFU37_24480 [Pyrinomonadaceae bacterium]|nr:hypothetical protein [Pyrinomonadaceae bacterium]